MPTAGYRERQPDFMSSKTICEARRQKDVPGEVIERVVAERLRAADILESLPFHISTKSESVQVRASASGRSALESNQNFSHLMGLTRCHYSIARPLLDSGPGIRSCQSGRTDLWPPGRFTSVQLYSSRSLILATSRSSSYFHFRLIDDMSVRN